MEAPPFVHLHCHSHFSLLDGASPIKKLVARAKELGMNGLALTDHGNLYGALEFYRACKEAGINPVVGYEAYIAPGSRFDKGGASSSKEASYHLTLLAQNRTGFKNLVKMASSAYLEGFYHKPRIDKQLLADHSEGIICLSGCVSGELSRTLLAGHTADEAMERGTKIVEWFEKTFGPRYFLEIQDNGVDIQRAALELTVELSKKVGVPLVATSDAHYVNREDAEAQDVLLCINTGKYRTDSGRMKMEGDEFFLRSPEEMFAALPEHADALGRSQTIADSVDIDLELGKRFFPTFTTPGNSEPDIKASEAYLRELVIAGLKERYADTLHRWQNNDPATGELSDEVMARVDRELYVIDTLGFPDYFLIVWDFVRFAVDNNIPCTARGSGVGSLVCFSLKLSHVCPLEYDLLFERFLDISRLEAPDIDIDFCKHRRVEVIQYVKEKYGDANVAQIGTFGTLAARAAIKDVGRTMSMPIFRVDQITAMIPDQLGISIDKALEQSDDLKKAYEADPEIRELIDLARKIEGLARNVGTHAAAVVIAKEPVSEYVPLQHVKGKTEVITQWAMGDVEAAGLLKMDFLGLRNLTILARSIDLIEESTGERIDPYKFPLDDRESYALLCRGETKGIFQLESGGIRDLLQRMRPDNFRDIIATAALYRPGPLEGGMVDQYIEVKHNRREAEYPHPVMEEVLSETHGVMVYQEQVMRILNRLGGIELSNAYKCIKAISKKKLPIIAKFREQFLDGAQEQGLDKKKAEELFGMIEKFAGYGFNKCLVESTVIQDATTGERTTIGDLFRNRRPFAIHSLSPEGKLEPRQVTDVVWNGRKRTYRVRTAGGRELIATGNHPLKTFDGWTEVQHLKVGDRVAAPRRLDIEGDTEWSRHQVITLGWLLSEGNTCHPSCLYFYNNDRQLVDDFVEHVGQFDDTLARIDVRRGHRMEVCVSTGRDARFQPGQSAQPQATAAPARSGAYRWAAGLGILDKRAREKFVPAEAFRLGDQQVALLLGRMWSGDGFVGKAGQMPYYATSSLQLATDVQDLLLRLGITAGVRTKVMRYQYKGQRRERLGYTVHLVGDESVRQFVRVLGPEMVGRDSELAAYREYLDSVERATSKDTLPAAVRRMVDEHRREAGLGWRQLEQQSGVSMREFSSKNSPTKKGFRRATIGRLAKFFESESLRQVAESDLYWDRIVSIEPDEVQDTYDLTVDEHHNFVAEGLVVHNSHSTAYALIAYMTAYLKAHYPVQFMAALLSGDIPGRNFKSKDSLVEHLEDCTRMQIEVVPPDVNKSYDDFAVREGKILFGLSAIKACGGGAAEAIVAAREKDGPFRSLFDFCERIDPHSCNRATIETLIKAGAFDSLGAERARLMAGVERAIQSGASAMADRKSGQKGLFDEVDDAEEEDASIDLPDATPWEEKVMLNYEKEVLGFYLSSHPLAEFEKTLRTYTTHNSKTVGSLEHRTEVVLGGMLAAIKMSHTKNPKPGMPSKYAMWDLEDLDGIVRCIMWPEQFAQFGEHVVADAIVGVTAVVDRRPGAEEVNLIINELMPIEALAERFTSGLAVRVDEARHGIDILAPLHEIVRGYPGNKTLRLHLALEDGSMAQFESGKRVDLVPELRRRLDELLGSGSVLPIGSPPKPTSGGNGNGRGRGKYAR